MYTITFKDNKGNIQVGRKTYQNIKEAQKRVNELVKGGVKKTTMEVVTIQTALFGTQG